MAYIRRSKEIDVKFLAPLLRPEDVNECHILSGTDPLTALRVGFEQSNECYTLCNSEDTPVGMFGVNEHSSDVGLIWLLISDDALDPPTARSLLRLGRDALERISEPYEYVWNWVPVDAYKTNKWLTVLGFKPALSQEFSGVPCNLMLRKR